MRSVSWPRAVYYLLAVYRYSREDLIRILRLNSRQLAAWERAGLLASAESYTFFDLLQVKKVRDLCARHVRPVEIRQSLAAMQKQAATGRPSAGSLSPEVAVLRLRKRAKFLTHFVREGTVGGESFELSADKLFRERFKNVQNCVDVAPSSVRAFHSPDL